MDGVIVNSEIVYRAGHLYAAKVLGLSEEKIRDYEHGSGDLDEAEVQALADALTYFGARFIPESDRGGVGVRRKFSRTKVKMIDTWESEGGPVGEDDF